MPCLCAFAGASVARCPPRQPTHSVANQPSVFAPSPKPANRRRIVRDAKTASQRADQAADGDEGSSSDDSKEGEDAAGKQSDGKQSDGKQSDGKQPDGKQSDGKKEGEAGGEKKEVVKEKKEKTNKVSFSTSTKHDDLDLDDMV